MTIIEALVQLRDDLKTWVANNLRAKLSTKSDVGHTHIRSEISDLVATSTNTANAIVQRDEYGNFSTHEIILENVSPKAITFANYSGINMLWASSDTGKIGLCSGGGDGGEVKCSLVADSDGAYPGIDNIYDLGKSDVKWANIYATTINGTKVYGAVWNDYAEYRSQKDNVEAGYCVASNDKGQVSKTTYKYQACDGIVSDTFGFAIGETDNCKTPLAVAGRVLVYCEGDRYNYHAGDTVCAGPGGKVVKMTREEIQMWPDRIVGIVSEIPEYETWGSGNIKVNGRIWIKVK